MKRILRYDWDAITEIIAATIVIVMHLLHLVDENVLLVTSVVFTALLFLCDLRHERQSERLETSQHQTEITVKEILAQLNPPDEMLLGPPDIRHVFIKVKEFISLLLQRRSSNIST